MVRMARQGALAAKAASVGHWPTTLRSFDFLRFHEITADQLSTFSVKRSMPGEYWIEPKDMKAWQRGMYLSLIDGGRTLSVKTDKAPLPKPKTKVRCEYESGQWWKYLASGRKPA